MKWAYSIVLVGIGVIGCTGKIPPPRGEVLNVKPADITTDVPPQITDVEPIHQRKRKTDESLRRAALAGLPVCEKSVMPGYSDGNALEAAIDGFNARGDDIDKCNRDIQEWVRKHVRTK